MLTPAEAAVVAGVSVRDINRVFDEPILPERFVMSKGDRRLRSDACAFVSFYFHTAKRLTSDERVRVISRLAGVENGPRVYKDELLTVNFGPFVKDARTRLTSLVRAKEAVTRDPGILSGTPVIKGTRVPVRDVAASVRAGLPWARVKSAYPGLTDELIEAALLYADAHPERGRPPRLGEARPELELISERKAARRRP
ncbi:MAG TPA: DUF433 domain-containing protein [Caulobacteraceae bacterium]|nr:DUF433 domain-containing protein [Caulobacteraceae bacterium]